MKLHSKSTLLLVTVILLVGCGVEYQFGRASKLTNKGKYNKAVQIYAEILKKAPESSLGRKAALKMSDVFYLNLKDYERAISGYQGIMEKWPGTPESKCAEEILPEVVFNYASDCMKKGNFEKGFELYDEIASKYSRTVWKSKANNEIVVCRFVLADVYRDKDLYDLAIEQYKKVIEMFPSSRVAVEAEERSTRTKKDKIAHNLLRSAEDDEKREKLIEALVKYKRIKNECRESKFTSIVQDRIAGISNRMNERTKLYFTELDKEWSQLMLASQIPVLGQFLNERQQFEFIKSVKENIERTEKEISRLNETNPFPSKLSKSVGECAQKMLVFLDEFLADPYGYDSYDMRPVWMQSRNEAYLYHLGLRYDPEIQKLYTPQK